LVSQLYRPTICIQSVFRVVPNLKEIRFPGFKSPFLLNTTQKSGYASKTQTRSKVTSGPHSSLMARISFLIESRLDRSKWKLFVGDIGYIDTLARIPMRIVGADLALWPASFGIPSSVFPCSPYLLIEIISPYNLTSKGEAEFKRKIDNALKDQTKVVWVIFPQTEQKDKIYGVQVHTDNYQKDKPLLKGGEFLPDGGINLKISPEEIFE